jgi:hypothetical protein
MICGGRLIKILLFSVGATILTLKKNLGQKLSMSNNNNNNINITFH